MMKDYFPDDPIKQALFFIVFYHLKEDYDAWFFIGGTIESFRGHEENKSKIIIIEHITGKKIEEIFK